MKILLKLSIKLINIKKRINDIEKESTDFQALEKELGEASQKEPETQEERNRLDKARDNYFDFITTQQIKNDLETQIKEHESILRKEEKIFQGGEKFLENTFNYLVRQQVIKRAQKKIQTIDDEGAQEIIKKILTFKEMNSEPTFICLLEKEYEKEINHSLNHISSEHFDLSNEAYDDLNLFSVQNTQNIMEKYSKESQNIATEFINDIQENVLKGSKAYKKFKKTLGV